MEYIANASLLLIEILYKGKHASILLYIIYTLCLHGKYAIQITLHVYFFNDNLTYTLYIIRFILFNRESDLATYLHGISIFKILQCIVNNNSRIMYDINTTSKRNNLFYHVNTLPLA